MPALSVDANAEALPAPAAAVETDSADVAEAELVDATAAAATDAAANGAASGGAGGGGRGAGRWGAEQSEPAAAAAAASAAAATLASRRAASQRVEAIRRPTSTYTAKIVMPYATSDVCESQCQNASVKYRIVPITNHARCNAQNGTTAQ